MDRKHIDELLEFDAIDHAEKVAKKADGKLDGEMLGLGMHMMKTQTVKRVMQITEDTYYSMPVGEYLAVLHRMGFDKVYTGTFPAKYDDRDIEECHYILWHPEKAILVSLDTFGGHTVNGSRAYFHWCEYEGTPWHHLPINGCYQARCSIDAREAFRHYIEKMELIGEFKNPWEFDRKPFLWLLNYGDKKHDLDKSQTVDVLNNYYLNKLPHSVRKAIGR